MKPPPWLVTKGNDRLASMVESSSSLNVLSGNPSSPDNYVNLSYTPGVANFTVVVGSTFRNTDILYELPLFSVVENKGTQYVLFDSDEGVVLKSMNNRLPALKVSSFDEEAEFTLVSIHNRLDKFEAHSPTVREHP